MGSSCLSTFLANRRTRLSRPRILSVGNLAERKGLKYLVRACRRLKDQGIEFLCHIIGDGEERANLEALVDELDLGGHVFPDRSSPSRRSY